MSTTTPTHTPNYPILDDFAFGPRPPARQEQLYRFFRDAIVSGRLPAGSRLPPTRSAAAELKVSRQLVVMVYERLLAEGMLDGRHGSGSFVSAAASPFSQNLGRDEGEQPIEISARLRQILDDGLRTRTSVVAPLTPGIPDVSMFPFNTVSKIAARFRRSHAGEQLAYGDPLGVRELREAVAGFLRSFRGVRCAADQVIITNGAQPSFTAAAHVLADVGDVAIAENPGYSMVHHALRLAGLRLRPMRVDQDGLRVSKRPRGKRRPKLLVCTPAHHYPLGVTAPLSRRIDLLTWAEENDAFIIEDDYDSEFRYEGTPVPALSVLDRSRGRVIYAGTFSKLLAPGLRIGFLVVPHALIDAFSAVRSVIDRHPGAPMQHICAEFITGGYLAAHIRKMKPVYAERRAALIRGLGQALPAEMALIGTDAGLHACLLMPDAAAERHAHEIARLMSLGCRTVSSFTAPGAKTDYWGLAFGFSTTDAETTYQLTSEFADKLSSSFRAAKALARQS